MPRTLKKANDAHTKGELTCALATRTRLPSPELEPTNSPITAPITASVTATLAPEKMNGSAEGTWIFQKICRRVHLSARARSSRSAGVARSPVAVSTTIGKKATTDDLLDLARALKCTRLQIFWKIQVP